MTMVRLRYPWELIVTHMPILLSFMMMLATVRSEGYYCSHTIVNIYKENWGKITTRMPWETYYTNNLRCVWTIDAGIARRIRITFIKINLEQLVSGTSCEEGDFLSIREGETEVAPVLVKICPGATNPYEIISRGRHLHLVFTSNQNSFLDYGGIEMKFEVFDTTDCPPEWISGPDDLYTGHQSIGMCYRVMTKPAGGADFLTAQKFCTYSQSNLARISSDNLFDFVLDIIKKHRILFYLWVGLTDKKKEGAFQWLDGSNFNSTERMSSVSVNDENKNCVKMSLQSKSYHVVHCDDYYFYICQLNLEHTSIYTVPTEVAEAKGESHYSMEFSGVLWIIIGAVIAVASIVYCVAKVHEKKVKHVNYSSRQLEGQRSFTMPNQSSSQTEQDIDASQACLVQPSTQPAVEPLTNSRPVLQPSAPPLSELQPVIGPPSSDQGAPPSYWEVCIPVCNRPKYYGSRPH